MAIRETSRNRWKHARREIERKGVRNSANPSVARIFFFFFSSSSSSSRLEEGKWVTRLNGSQDIVPGIIRYGRGDTLLFHRRPTLFGWPVSIETFLKLALLQWAVAPAVAALAMLSLVVNILTKENLESARDTVDIRNTVTKYGEERLRDKVELVLREIVGIPATVEFPTPSRGHLSRKPSFREATRNLIVFQTFDALKHVKFSMWDYPNYSRINNYKFPLRKRNNLERSSLQDNKIRRLLRSISIIIFF